MPTSGGAGNGPVFGQPARVDKSVYKYIPDYPFFSRVLKASGYLPYTLTRADNKLRQTVWATCEADVTRYADGDVKPAPEDMQVQSDVVVILVSGKDGGYVNEHGYVVYHLPNR